MVSIVANCVEGPTSVDAHVFGEWAAHQAIGATDIAERLSWWVVTHVPTGRCIYSAVGKLTDVEARHLALRLSESVPAGIVPPLPADASVNEIPDAAKRAIRSVIYDVRGVVLP